MPRSTRFIGFGIGLCLLSGGSPRDASGAASFIVCPSAMTYDQYSPGRVLTIGSTDGNPSTSGTVGLANQKAVSSGSPDQGQVSVTWKPGTVVYNSTTKKSDLRCDATEVGNSVPLLAFTNPTVYATVTVPSVNASYRPAYNESRRVFQRYITKETSPNTLIPVTMFTCPPEAGLLNPKLDQPAWLPEIQQKYRLSSGVIYGVDRRTGAFGLISVSPRDGGAPLGFNHFTYACRYTLARKTYPYWIKNVPGKYAATAAGFMLEAPADPNAAGNNLPTSALPAPNCPSQMAVNVSTTVAASDGFRIDSWEGTVPNGTGAFKVGEFKQFGNNGGVGINFNLKIIPDSKDANRCVVTRGGSAHALFKMASPYGLGVCTASGSSFNCGGSRKITCPTSTWFGAPLGENASSWNPGASMSLRALATVRTSGTTDTLVCDALFLGTRHPYVERRP